MKTLYLDPTSWDLVLDSGGNIALAAEPYSIAQDVASAIRTFLGEVYYNTAQGLPYFGSILGTFPMPLALMKSKMIAAALAVPDVASVKIFFSSIARRTVAGQIQITSSDGAVAAINVNSFGRLDYTAVLDQTILG